MTTRARFCSVAACGLLVAVPVAARGPVEVLQSVGALPPHISGRFEDPIGFAQAKSGEYVVLDRRSHTLYAIDAKRTTARKMIEVGLKQGQLLGPGQMTISRDNIVMVADAPGGFERIQYFDLSGLWLGGFQLQTKARTIVATGGTLGFGSVVTFTGNTFLVARQDQGALFQELDLQGRVLRQIGQLRKTGQEADPEVHRALNAGIALADSSGGFVFVFRAGRPMFRRYNAQGTLVSERHIEGAELDPTIQSLPGAWPSPAVRQGTLPVVEFTVQTAAIDAKGELWISLAVPYTYVYDRNGDKRRTIQFRGTEIIGAKSLSFSPDGARVLVTPGCYEFSSRSPVP